MRIKITIGKIKVHGRLRSTPTTEQLMMAVPLDAEAQTWGQEVFFSIPVDAELEEDAKQVVPPGSICFWAEGNCLAIPFGPTPIARESECRLADKCNILGMLEGDPKVLNAATAGDPVHIEICFESGKQA